MDTAAVIVCLVLFVGLMAPMSVSDLFADHPANQPDGDEEE